MTFMNRGKRMLCLGTMCLLTLSSVGMRGQAAARQGTPAAGAVQASAASGAAGTWQGTLTPPNGKGLRIVMKVTTADGKWSAVMYSIDQGGQPMKASSVTVNGDTVNVDVSLIGGAFAGKLSKDGNSLDGTWTQGPTPVDLKLARSTPETAWEIPAPPPPPKLMPANADPSFEVATIKPDDTGATQMKGLHVDGSNRFSTVASSLTDLISFAYDVQVKQISGNEGWMSDDRYDIMAKPDVEGSPNPAQLKVMIKKLLADRFALKMHEEKREMSAFVLTVAKGGPKFKETEMAGPLPGLGFRPGKGGLTFVMRNATMNDFAGIMQVLVLDRPVVDETGLTGHYDMTFTFTPDGSMFNGHAPPLPPGDATTEQAPGIVEGMEKDAGLKLEAKKTPVTVWVIDHVAKPTGN